MSLSSLVAPLIFTTDGVFETYTGWITVGVVVGIIGLIAVGRLLSQDTSTLTAIEFLASFGIAYLLYCLLLDGGRALRAVHYSMIPYVVLAVVILIPRWNRLTRVDRFLLSWSWVPLIFVVMPLIYRYMEGKAFF